MRQLNGIYTQRFNRDHDRVGHVFQGRYKAIHVEKESYLLELSRYIVLNPVRARMVHTAAEWPWSSYRATIGGEKVPSWLNVEWLLAAFGVSKRKAVSSYKKFVAEGLNQPAPWEHLKNQVFLGGDAFVEELVKVIDGEKALSEIPSSQRRKKPLSLKEYGVQGATRNESVVQAYASGGYTQKEIADYFDLHYASVSRIVKYAKCKT